MRRFAAIIALIAIASPAMYPATTNSFEYNDFASERQLRWPSKTIKVALSKSLNNPGTNIKLESDVMGAARRALSRWSSVTEIQFEVVESSLQSISPPKSGDGISLITIAETFQNNAIFNGNGATGRTRVFYDEETGEISEADVVINPHPTSADGLPVQFSTDGTRGTYDLESTFTHELGHLLGLDHSPIIASTMHQQQALNGVYGKPAFTERTLSEEDRTRARNLYGSLPEARELEGRITQLNHTGQQVPASNADVWVEDIRSGRVIASSSTADNGRFRLGSLAPDSYRVMSRSFTPSLVTPGANGTSNEISLKNKGVEALELSVLASSGTTNRFLTPRLIGANGDLSTTPVPIAAGKRIRLYVAGEGVDLVSEDGLSVTSPYFKIESASLQKESFPTPYPVISFEITTASNAPFGDYSLRLQSKTSEVAYVPGGLTIDPGVESNFANPSDDPQFFVKQQYRDFLGRDPDATGLDYWTAQLAQCGHDDACLRSRRVKISTAFLSEPEFQQSGAFVHRLYRVALGRVPTFAEFENAREAFVAGQTGLTEVKQKVARELTEAEEFRKKYPADLSPSDFVSSLLLAVSDALGVSVNRRGSLLELAKESDGFAKVLQTIADESEVMNAENDRAFVLMQFFGYLQRDPDQEDFKVWLNALNAKRRNDPARFASVSCAFVNSAEYQSRFGMVKTHDPSECETQ